MENEDQTRWLERCGRWLRRNSSAITAMATVVGVIVGIVSLVLG